MTPNKDLDEQIEKIFYNPDHTKTHNPSGRPTGVIMTDFDIMEAKQQLLALIEQREREARIDELRHCCARCGVWHSETHNISQVRLTFRERIQALQKGAEKL